MTLATACTPRVVIIGNGSLGPYSLVDSSSVAIRFVSTSHIKLTRYASATDDNNDGTVLVLNTDFSVAGTQDARTFTLIGSQAVLTSSQRIVAERVQSYTQDLDLTTGGAFNASSVESRFDKLAEFQQELKARLDRTVPLQFSDATANVGFPSPPTSATQFLARNTAGEIVYATAADLSADVALGTDWETILGLPAAGILDNLSGVRYVATYAALTALTTASGLSDNSIYCTYARTTEEDGGFGFWRYDSASITTENSGTILAVDGGGAGRFFRLYQGPVYAKWFGATMNTAIAAAITAGFDHILIDSDFTLTTKITLGGETILEGIGQRRPIITKGASVDMFDMSANDCGLRFLNLQGAGGTYTGRGVIVGGGTDQFIEDCYLLDHNGYALEFTAVDAGQRFRASCSLFRRTTTTNAAIGLPDSVSETAGNRYFDQCGGLGGTLMAFRQGINTILTGCNFTNLDFSGSSGISLRAIINGCRGALLSGTLTINGGDVSIEGGMWAGDIVLDTGTQRCRIHPGGLLTGTTITDNSTATGNNVNEIWDGYYTITPVWKADSVDPAIVNGTLTGRIYRSGRKLKVEIQITCGSSTTYGTGAWYFTLPSPFSTWVAKATASGPVRILDNGSQYYNGTAVITAGSGRIYLFDTQGVSATVPMTWTNPDTMVLTVEFEIA